jgi:MFS family permease
MHLLRRAAFARLCFGSALNAIGSWAALIALWGFAAVHFHAGANGIALIGLAWSLPGAVLSPLAGVPVDRFGPKRVLLVSDVVGIGAAVALAFAASFSQLLALALLIGVVAAAGKPAALALPARLVGDEDLLAANSMLGVAEQSAMVVGPLVGSVAISLWGIGSAFLFDAATFAVGALAVAGVRLRNVAPADVPARVSVVKELAEGLRLARRIGDVRRTLALAGAVFLSWGAFFVLEPLYVRDVLHRSPAVLGLFQTVFGVGLLATTALLPKIGDRVASVRVLAMSVAVSGVAAAVYVGTHSIVVAMVGVFLWGVDVAFFMPPMQTLLQRSTPVSAHGRVLSLSSTISSLGDVVAIPVAGLLVAVMGVSLTGALVGALAVVAGVAGVVVTRSGGDRTPSVGGHGPAGTVLAGDRSPTSFRSATPATP